MSILWADNFQSYGVGVGNTLSDGIYAQTAGYSVVDDPDPNAGAESRVVTASAGADLNFALPSGALTTVGSSFRVYCPRFNAIPFNGVFSFKNASGSSLWQLGYDATGALIAQRGSTVLGSTSVPVLRTSTWEHVEIKTTLDDVTGSIEVKLNGITVLNISGVDNKNTTGDCAIVGFEPTDNIFYKDFIVWDTAGSVNNDFLGTCSVITLRPNGDDILNWTPSSGSTGWDLINEATANDANYVSAGDPPPGVSEFELENLPPDVTSVKGLVSVYRARKVDGGDGNVQTALVGTLADVGADRPVTTDFSYRYDVSELSPDTAALWTPVEVDAVKLRIDRTL